jgi:hypothetical protein
MLEATSYGLIALGVILVAAFCFIWVEERVGLQAYRPSSLVDERNVNLLRTAGALAVNRSRRESVGKQEITGLVLSIQMTSPAQTRSSGSAGNSLLRKPGPEVISNG